MVESWDFLIFLKDSWLATHLLFGAIGFVASVAFVMWLLRSRSKR